jgi:hypothetical protein
MGANCSCMRFDLLEEKTILIADIHHLNYKPSTETLNHLKSTSRCENSNETSEDSDSTRSLSSLSRRFLALKSLKSPALFFQACEKPFEAYIPERIAYIESLLSPISIPLSFPVFQLKNDEIYQGGFDDCLRKSGFGLQLLAGEKFIGYFSKGKRHGFGRLLKADESVFEGDFFEGLLEGDGICIENGIRYKGNFSKGMKAGEGREEWPDKTVYEGEYWQNLKHGKGKFEWANGNRFKGEIENGEICGVGRFTWKNGKKYKGMWKDNKMHGKGVFYWPNGDVYEGEYFEDKKHGEGKMIFADNREYEGEWTNGVQHGTGVYKWFNKMKNAQESRTGVWENGVRVKWIS